MKQSDTQKGILISFDGLDSSGKATQTNKLVKKLKSLGHTVVRLETPDYSTPSGQELKKRLQGKLGDWANTPWQEKIKYFAANRAENKEKIAAALNAGHIVIYDRYVPSSLAFIAAEAVNTLPLNKGEREGVREEVYQAIQHEEYEKNGMPEEDASIFLDVPPAVAEELLTGRKKRRQDEDEYTDALEVQQALYDEYTCLTRQDPNRYIHIQCVEEKCLCSVDDVADKVWQELTQRFPQLDK